MEIKTFGTVTMHADMEDRSAVLMLGAAANTAQSEADQDDALAWLTGHGAREIDPVESYLDATVVAWLWSHDCPAAPSQCPECSAVAAVQRAEAAVRLAYSETEEFNAAGLASIRPTRL